EPLNKQAIAIDSACLTQFREVLSSLPRGWFDAESPQVLDTRLCILPVDEVTYVTGLTAATDSPRLIIQCGAGRLADGLRSATGEYLLDRCLRFGMHVFDRGMRLPMSWKAFHHQNLVTFFAFPPGLGN